MSTGTEEIISCTSCGQKNRLFNNHSGTRFLCGRCKTPLYSALAEEVQQNHIHDDVPETCEHITKPIMQDAPSVTQQPAGRSWFRRLGKVLLWVIIVLLGLVLCAKMHLLPNLLIYAAFFAAVVGFIWLDDLVKRGGSEGEKKGCFRVQVVVMLILGVGFCIFFAMDVISKLISFFE